MVEAKRAGEPRLAREAANQLARYREAQPDVYGVFFAPYVSPKAAEVCAEEGIGYLDLSGNCRLSFGEVYVEREGRPNKFGEKRDLRTLYSPKATRVIRVLLGDPSKTWKVVALAEEAGVSVGLASNVKKLLANREWTREGEPGFALSRPKELLSEWSDSYSFRQNEARDYYSLNTPGQVEAALAETCDSQCIQYALTAFSAAARMAPAVRYHRVFAYVGQETEEVASRLKLKQVDSGPNVTLLLPYDEGVFYAAQNIDGIQTASAIQAYVDLVTFRGRGEEAANAILEQVIIPQW